MTSAFSRLLLLLLVLTSPASAAPVPDPQGEWTRLTNGAAEMGLPSKFLRLLPVEFVKLEFADLKNVAAEYHPDGHRMVFHLNLSEGSQGKRLRPLREIASRDLATIYHELFHAYFDYVDFASGTPKMSPQGARLHAEARRLLACRYTVVEIIAGPRVVGPQFRARVERRRLAESEGWEALNETWGVFVGWAVWNKLETTDRMSRARRWDWEALENFLNRLEEAYQSGDLAGYFEVVNPEGPEGRKAIPRLYLAPGNSISAPEIALLFEIILDESPGMAKLAANWIAASDAPVKGIC
jgi:hypothetical protein